MVTSLLTRAKTQYNPVVRKRLDNSSNPPHGISFAHLRMGFGFGARTTIGLSMVCFRFWYKLLLPADYLLFHARILVQPSTCYRLLIIPRIPLKFQRGAFYSGFHKIEKSQTTMSHTTLKHQYLPLSTTIHHYSQPQQPTTQNHHIQLQPNEAEHY